MIFSIHAYNIAILYFKHCALQVQFGSMIQNGLAFEITNINPWLKLNRYKWVALCFFLSKLARNGLFGLDPTGTGINRIGKELLSGDVHVYMKAFHDNPRPAKQWSFLNEYCIKYWKPRWEAGLWQSHSPFHICVDVAYTDCMVPPWYGIWPSLA